MTSRVKVKQTLAPQRAASTLQWTWQDPLSVPRRAASTARWYIHESDTTRRLYHTEPRPAGTARWHVHESDTIRRLYHTEPRPAGTARWNVHEIFVSFIKRCLITDLCQIRFGRRYDKTDVKL